MQQVTEEPTVIQEQQSISDIQQVREEPIVINEQHITEEPTDIAKY